MPPSRNRPVEIDSDDEDTESSTYLTDEAPYVFRSEFPAIPTTSQTRKRNAAVLDSPSESPSPVNPLRNEPGPSAKRLRRPGERVRHLRQPPPTSAEGTATPAEIEAIDLTDDSSTNPLKEALQKQREEQIKAQREDAGKPLMLTKLTCVICMDTPTDLTATNCGHLYCHLCLNEALKAGEVRRRSPQDQHKIPNCPVCRKRLDRKKESDVIPLLIMKRTKAKP